MTALDSVQKYFDLFSEHRSKGYRSLDQSERSFNWWLAAQYAALWLGVCSKLYLDSVAESYNSPPNGVARLIISLIVSTAAFPAVYKGAFDDSAPSIVQLCVTFSTGLGFKTLIDIDV
jgi:hypothetical protein